MYFISEVGAPGFIADIGRGAFGLSVRSGRERSVHRAATAGALRDPPADRPAHRWAGRHDPDGCRDLSRPAGTRSAAPIGGRLIAPLRNVSTGSTEVSAIAAAPGLRALKTRAAELSRCCTESTPRPARWVRHHPTPRPRSRPDPARAGHPRELVRRGRSGRRPPPAPEGCGWSSPAATTDSGSPPARRPGSSAAASVTVSVRVTGEQHVDIPAGHHRSNIQPPA